MSDRETGRGHGSSDSTRRGFLALAGSAAVGTGVALAGCNQLDPRSKRTTISGDALSEAVARESPAVPQRLPIDVEQSYLDQSTESVRETLSTVPAPLTADQIPNGEIRRRLMQSYEDATERLQAVTQEDTTPATTLNRLQSAHREAGTAAAGWGAVESDYGYEALREESEKLLGDVDAFRRRWRYVGDDPVRSVLAHAEIEHNVANAGHNARSVLSQTTRQRETALSVGDSGGKLLSARNSLADASYLFDRYVDSLDSARPVGDGLRDAGESLIQTVENRRDSLPDQHSKPGAYVDADVDDTYVGYALEELRDVDYAGGIEDERESGRWANVVLSGHQTLVKIRAFEQYRDRVERGDYPELQSAADVETIRDGALDTVETALDEQENHGLERRMLTDLVRTVEYVTRELRREAEGKDGEVYLGTIQYELAELVTVRERATVTPQVSTAVADLLEANL